LDNDISAPLKFGVSQSVPRKEDPRLLRGEGRYTDDFELPGQLYAVFLRSPHAHGRILRLDATAARSAPGVQLVLTQAEIDEAGYKTLPCAVALQSRGGEPMIVPPHPALARDRVRYVGQPMAIVVAESLTQARDAAAMIEPEIEPLPAVTDMEAALANGAPQLFEEMPGNLALDWGWGDAEAVERAFAGAAHIARVRVDNNRVVVSPLEPRGAIADFEDGRFVLRVGCQGVFGMRQQLAGVLGVEPEQVRVFADDVGGSFGMKASVFPEHVPLLHAARTLGHPVRWINDRSESFLADYHGRNSVFTGELALNAEGHFLAVRVDGIGDVGAYVTAFGPAVPTTVIQKNLPGPYRTPLMAMRVRCAVTNTVPMTAYRGAGRPEGAYIMERLVDAAARDLGRDPVELRRQNMIRRDELPFKLCSGMEVDSGDLSAALDLALQQAGWDEREARRRSAAARGKLYGAGVCTYLEVTAPAGKEMGGIRFESNGRVTIVTGTLDYGQGHASPFAQVLSERLGIPFDRIDLLQGDSDQLLYGGGTGGSKSIMSSGTAIITAANQVVENGRKLAGHLLEAAVEDIRFEAGGFTVAGTDRAIGVLELARRVREQPPGNGLPSSLDVALVADTPPATFPNGAHIAEVEVDPDTGVVTLERYVGIDDFGTLVNPMLVEGQVHGGLAQGIGQALLERTVYDRSGQLLTGSFMDYTLPRADTLPSFELDFRAEPATTNLLGVKGCGEAGVTAAPPAVMSAVLDALRPLGVAELDMPATPERVWAAIRAAGNGLPQARG
jgi:carbon-monoxide dehydrogenase large subunit